MQNKNPLFLGFLNVKHYFNTLFDIKNFFLHFCFGLFLSVFSNIFNITYETHMCILLLCTLLGFNFLVGVSFSIRKKSFSSNKLPKTLILLLSYSIILIHFWEVTKDNSILLWLPSMFYGIFLSITINNTFKNLHKINIIK